ncbi:MAG: hypothetical protein A2504_12485 [Bdellovibrionales bacterium RIFOXYD12_FULL_39_22]|nr:MAG: hypothetical protein A2385_00175 [Bdellovibrionales bacterium RIFOXYB1_FULL_39_21]OFZ44072.1 MAG: hypothetical protein A2485_03840 [Bdellovibrionales bacterium RIFOXYC12_FULL_39_17]OFZ48526.1 MAG: hypothetical protein A2404_07230 [Bdellovibrionales bacterium RIFOXYC1_FULL_39_130]OFZ71326.1 MAG: hypothetical protein A2451_10005 [Bdellovibrionales bacterium RIFOXYC2_FULL_39_8]OFZ76714.1 MAG: hypothetical protein A2560_11605 [Bdellovibrionales bacterium RIFOXYD1_FULL_39_84]OFZ94992.1 MAG:
MAIFLSLVAAAIGALAQYFYKLGAARVLEIPIYKNVYIFLGLISFSAVLVLFIVAFRLGGKMFVIYPVYATTYIWSGLLAYFVAKEPINHWQIIGVICIMLGVSIISLGHEH